MNPVQPQSQFTGSQGNDGRKVILTDAWSINSHVVNDFRASFSRLNGPNIVPPVNTPPNLVPPTPGTPGPSSNFIYRRPGADVARALHTVYLIFLVGGLIGSLLYPMFLKRAPHLRRRPLLV